MLELFYEHKKLARALLFCTAVSVGSCSIPSQAPENTPILDQATKNPQNSVERSNLLEVKAILKDYIKKDYNVDFWEYLDFLSTQPEPVIRQKFIKKEEPLEDNGLYEAEARGWYGGSDYWLNMDGTDSLEISDLVIVTKTDSRGRLEKRWINYYFDRNGKITGWPGWRGTIFRLEEEDMRELYKKMFINPPNSEKLHIDTGRLDALVGSSYNLENPGVLQRDLYQMSRSGKMLIITDFKYTE